MATLRLDVILSAIDKASAPMRALAGTSKALSGEYKKTRDEMKALQAQQKDVARYQGLNGKLQETATKLNAAQQRVRELRTQMRTGGETTKAFQRDFTKANEAVRDLTQKIQIQRMALGPHAQKLREAGVNLSQLGTHEKTLAASIQTANTQLDAQKRKLAETGARMQKLADAKSRYDATISLRNKMAGTGAAAMATGAAIGAPIVRSVLEYNTFEDAMLGIQRQVSDIGLVGSTSYKQIATEVRLLGRVLPIPIEQLTDMYTAASRMEVPREALKDFTTTVTMMSTAFDALPDEIAETMGKVAKNYGIAVTDIGSLADTINWLDDNASSKGSDIIDSLNRIAGVAGMIKLTDKNAAALVSTLLTLGETGETAGTSISTVLQKLNSAGKSKEISSGLLKIGMSARQVETGMQTDAQATVLRIVEKINKLPEAKRGGIITQLAGINHAKIFSKLVKREDEWRRQIELANSSEAQGSMEREFRKRSESLGAYWQRLKNSLFDFDTEVGGSLRPTLVGLMKSITGILQGLSDWMRKNPETTATLVKVAAAAAALVTVFGAVTLALAALLGPFAMLRYGLTLFSAFLPALKAMGVFMTSGAIGITLAVSLIVAAFLMLYMNWEKVCDGAKWLFNDVTAFFAQAWEGTKLLFNGAIEFIKHIFNGGLYDLLLGLPEKFGEMGGNIVNGLVQGIKDRIGAAKDAILSLGDYLPEWMRKKLDMHSPSRIFAQIGTFTVLGLAQGVTAAQGDALAAIGDTTQQIIATARAGLDGIGVGDFGAIRFDNRAPLVATSAEAGSCGAVNNYWTINISAPPGTDMQEMQRMVENVIEQRERSSTARRRSRLGDLE